MSNDEGNNSLCCSSKCASVLGYAAAVLIAVVIVFGLNAMLRSYTQPVEEQNREARGVERKAARAKLQGEATAAATGYGDPDPNNIRRVPLQRGMQLIVAEYQNGEASRAVLNARVTKFQQKVSFD